MYKVSIVIFFLPFFYMQSAAENCPLQKKKNNSYLDIYKIYK